MDGDTVYQELVNLVPDVAYGVDAATRTIVWLNPAFEAITGWQVDEWIGTPFPEILHPDDVSQGIAIFKDVLGGRTTPPQLLRVRAKSGTYLTGEFRSAPHIKDGEVIGVFGIARDVTQRIRFEERQRFLSDISVQLASSLDYETTLIEIAQSSVPFLADWSIIYRYERDGSIRRVAIAYSDSDHADIARAISHETTVNPDVKEGIPQVIRTGQPLLYPDVDVDLLARDVDDPARLAQLLDGMTVTSWMCVPLNARNQILGAIAFTTTESERRYCRHDLEFAQEIAARAAMAMDNAQLYTASQQAIREREEFISIASHELKTPLTTTKGLIQMLLRTLERDHVDHERVMRLASQLSIQAERFENVIGDLLDASQIREGRTQLRLEWIDLVALSHQVLDRFRDSLVTDDHFSLYLEAPANVFGRWDPARLDQVLTNLISNALKYSPEGGEIRLAIRQDEDEVTLTVHDQGIGIPKREQGSLFQPFSRGETVRGSISGVGLGLYITRRIVEQHGGSVSIDSDSGSGSTFIVQLPLLGSERDDDAGTRSTRYDRQDQAEH